MSDSKKLENSEVTPPDNLENFLEQNLPEQEDAWMVPEDRFCRKMTEDEAIAADILRYFVDPKIAKNIDLSKLKLARTNFYAMSDDQHISICQDSINPYKDKVE